ncbi:CDP-glycerol--glycerophosphate glycerophosphotransferase [Pseudoalteromonas sp. CO325X]|uniref:CDP-glycerol glycerophosphotransferase family protein n=1 Tax=Pseudoalteromonas sp. CO325X TaxID=1777262 RepID=UPI001022CB01|nr:CDP-glycerol glycerophosphotransferase family protein [Pseudoalteromonas sp. CO325X]RZF87982.1 CDP-glycerol--glycerophosphate glycerophosphotransferase [Pseudoalteromonas sp. CO325X]
MYISQNYSYAILRPLQQVIRAHGGEVKWFLEGDEVNPDFLAENEQQVFDIKDVIAWQPHASFVPGNVIPSFVPGRKVAVFHGFDSGKRNRRGHLDHFNIRGCFDLYCTQGPSTTTRFQQLAQQHGFFRVRETGWSMLDPLFSPTPNNPYSSTDSRPTLLICSTFSKRLSLAPVLVERIKELRDSGKYRILVQFHPKMSADIVAQYKAMQNDSLSFVETDNVIPLLQAADVMLCDTSSILLMFLLLRRPVVTFNNQAPASHLLNVTDATQVEAAIDQALTRPPELMANIESFCQQLHPYQDGRSSERVLAATNDLIISDGAELKAKPLNLLRQFKMRKKLAYWRW